MASSAENKESEITLRNEMPKSGYEARGDKSLAESTLRNDTPITEHCLRKELGPPRTPAMNAHKKVGSSGNISWERTHFILALESGGT